MSETTAEKQWEAAKTAGFSKRICQHLVLSRHANNAGTFAARFKDVETIKSLAKMVGPSLPGFNMEACVEDFIAHDMTVSDFREQAVQAMAEADEHINAAPPTRGVASVRSAATIEARSAQIDKLKAGAPRG